MQALLAINHVHWLKLDVSSIPRVIDDLGVFPCVLGSRF